MCIWGPRTGRLWTATRLWLRDTRRGFVIGRARSTTLPLVWEQNARFAADMPCPGKSTSSSCPGTEGVLRPPMAWSSAVLIEGELLYFLSRKKRSFEQ
jgi:hypothetical protein